LKGKFRIVGVGGTFDELHKGHRALLMKAFEVGECVWIGLTTDEFASRLSKNHKVAPYEDRLKELKRFLEEEGLLSRARVIPLGDPYGPAATSEEMEVIVVSRETEPGAHKINFIREKNGLPPLKVIVIDMVPAENHIPISTTRIRRGEIDREGRLLKRVKIKAQL